MLRLKRSATISEDLHGVLHSAAMSDGCGVGRNVTLYRETKPAPEMNQYQGKHVCVLISGLK